MNRLHRLLATAAVPVLLAPLGMFLADRFAACRPTEQLPAAAPAVNDLALLLPADAARLDGKRGRFRVQIAGGADRRKVAQAGGKPGLRVS